MSERTGCATCRTVIDQSGRGRPAKYCSTACHRSAEYKIKRFSERIERMEDARDSLLIEKAKLVAGKDPMSLNPNTVHDVDAHLQVLEERIRHYEAGLLAAFAE